MEGQWDPPSLKFHSGTDISRDTMKHSMNAKNVHKLVNAFSETLI